MLIKLKSVSFIGIECTEVDVEVNVSERGFPSFNIVGLANKEISESRQRVKTALQNCGYKFPNKKITVNLAPADVPKDGSFYDLPIAAALLQYLTRIEFDSNSVFFGELSLSGELRKTRGVFVAARYCQLKGYKFYFPQANWSEMYLLNKNILNPVHRLNELENYTRNQLPAHNHNSKRHTESHDISEIIGQEFAKKALEISAAGGHHLLLAGPPGVGKSMLAQSFISLLPDLTADEELEVAQLRSITNYEDDLFISRPFRCPHHTITVRNMLGNSQFPGEIAMANRGILFLDEFCQFRKETLESLRIPIETKYVRIYNGSRQIIYPANFILLSCTNLCRCGNFGNSVKKCKCSLYEIKQYQRRLSGPILDRIDLFVIVPVIETSKYTGHSVGEVSQVIKARVEKARQIQAQRYFNLEFKTNSDATPETIKKYFNVSSQATTLLNSYADKIHLSTRGYIKTLKVSRTIADLAGESNIQEVHIAEALSYKNNLTIY